MSQEHAIVNTFEKGMNKDLINERQPPATYWHAHNVVNTSDEHLGVLSNELANMSFNVEDIPGKIVGVSYFAEIYQSALFVADGGASKIFLITHSTGNVQHVITDTDWGCEWGFNDCEMLYGELKLMECNDRILYFSSKCTYYKVNVDEILEERVKPGGPEVNCGVDCTYFQLMKCICAPTVNPIILEGGGYLPAGAYWAAVQFEDNDGNTSNWFPPVGPVHIGSDDNRPGEVGRNAIRIYIDSVKRGYDKLNIAVIRKINGVVTVEKVISRAHNNDGFAYDYTGTDPDATPIEISEVIVPGKKWIQGADLFQKDGRLYLYNVKQEFEPNYQKWANRIRVRAVEYEVTAETQKKYNLPSLMRGETYAFVCWLNYCDGTRSMAYHIPGPEAPVGGDEPLGENMPYMSSIVGPGTINTYYPFKAWDPIIEEPATLILPTEEGEAIPTATINYPQEGKIAVQAAYIDAVNGRPSTVSFTVSPRADVALKAYDKQNQSYTLFRNHPVDKQGFIAVAVDIKNFRSQYVGLAWEFYNNAVSTLGDMRIWSINESINPIIQFAGNDPDQIDPVDPVDPNNPIDPDDPPGGGTGGSNVGGNTGGGQYDPDENGQYGGGTYNWFIDPETGEGIDPGPIVSGPDCFDEFNFATNAEEFADYFNVNTDCFSTDMDIFSQFFTNIFDVEAGYGLDDENPPTGISDRIKNAAAKLYNDLIKQAWQYETGNVNWTNNSASKYDDQDTDNIAGLHPLTVRSDMWTDNDQNNLIDETPRVMNIFSLDPYVSDIPYPNQCDCDGNRMYPEGNIRHHLMPDNSESKHFASTQVGVESRLDRSVSPYKETWIRLLGVEFLDIWMPREEEVPKPLCPEKPITFGIIKRDPNNRSVIAKGLATHTFTGDVNGKRHVFGKHAVNSFEFVDVCIGNGTDSSKIGQDAINPTYLFHSLDTKAQNVPLLVDQVQPELELWGSGWRYGLYEKGERPERWFTGKRVDQRGARQAISLMQRTNLPPELGNVGDPNVHPRNVKAISYAPANSIVTPQKGFTDPLCNRFRESSVYMELESDLPQLTHGVGGRIDSSFVGDVLDHEVPIFAAAGWYTTLRRNITNQYGSVENQNAISIDITVPYYRPASWAYVTGICGDIHIGLHAFRRTSYISDKVGDDDQFKQDSTDGVGNRTNLWNRDRDITDNNNSYNLQQLNIEHWATRFPENGDINDPKNYAGLHTTDTYTLDAIEAATNRTAAESDYYYPRLVKTLVYYVGEFEVNPWKLQLGDEDVGQVVYPNLKTLSLDSNFAMNEHWPKGYLNRFYVEIEQPSQAMMAMRFMIKFAINLLAPLFLISWMFSMDTIVEGVWKGVIGSLMGMGWFYMRQILFNEEWLDKMAGLPIAKTDEKGGEDNYIRIMQFEDYWAKANMDFVFGNDFNINHIIPTNLNTCVCNQCDVDVTREIYYSHKQVLSSNIDSYEHFQANDYLEIPAHAGFLKRLFVEANRFYAHTTEGLWILQYNNVQAQYDDILSIVGKGDLLSEPQQLMEGSQEGFLGLTDANASISTHLGYFWADREAGQVYALTNGQPEVISDMGMHNFFKEHLRFCGGSQPCTDERKSTYVVLGFDPRLNRVLVTKKDTDAVSSWTISFHIPSKSWVSFHDYIPRFYIWSRRDMYTVSDNEIFIHNIRNNVNGYSRFKGCETSGSFIDFIAHEESGEAFSYKSTMVDCEIMEAANNDWLRKRHKFFSHVGVWNSTQGTGILPTHVRSDNPDNENDVQARLIDHSNLVDVNYAKHQWRINNLLDHVQNMNGYTVAKAHQCDPHITPVSQGEELDGLANLNDRYLAYRFVMPATDNEKLYLKSVITLITRQSE